jgi:hypothetical protein
MTERSPKESSTRVLEVKEPRKRVGGQLIVSDKAWLRLKRSLKAITRKTSPLSFDERIGKIKEIQRGWLNYFRGANIFTKLRDLDGGLGTGSGIAYGTTKNERSRRGNVRWTFKRENR